MHDCQHFVVMDLVIPLCVREAFQHEAYWVEQPIFLLLQQDGPHGEVGCIAFQAEKTGLGQEGKHWGRGDSTLQCIEGLLLGCSHDQSFDLWVSAWRGWGISEKLQMNLR